MMPPIIVMTRNCPQLFFARVLVFAAGDAHVPSVAEDRGEGYCGTVRLHSAFSGLTHAIDWAAPSTAGAARRVVVLGSACRSGSSLS